MSEARVSEGHGVGCAEDNLEEIGHDEFLYSKDVDEWFFFFWCVWNIDVDELIFIRDFKEKIW